MDLTLLLEDMVFKVIAQDTMVVTSLQIITPTLHTWSMLNSQAQEALMPPQFMVNPDRKILEVLVDCLKEVVTVFMPMYSQQEVARILE